MYWFRSKMVWRKYHPSIIRQPPSPPHHHHSLTAANKQKEEECTGVVGGKYNHLCKRKRIMNNESLPDDVFFEILAHLCAKDIYYAARLVCSKWYNMIYTHNFIHEHLQHAPHGLLFHSCSVDSLYVTMRQGRVEISKLTKFTLESWSSCNGLILEFHLPDTFYVVNPITNQIFALPLFIRLVTTGQPFMMAYDAARMEYKVVSASVSLPLEAETFMLCHVFTVGVDNSWRTIRGPHLTETDVQAIKLTRPLMTQGFIHWFGDSTSDILTFNVETEIITRNRLPKALLCRHISRRGLYFENRGYPATYLSTGGRLLSSLILCGKLLWEVWEMNPDSGEWRKLFDIYLEDDKWRLEQLMPDERSYGYLVPIGWVKYPEVLVFTLSDIPEFVLVYNLVGTFDKLEIHGSVMSYNVFHHQNSLLWLAGS